jgi:hypothetical protein
MKILHGDGILKGICLGEKGLFGAIGLLFLLVFTALFSVDGI